MNLQSNFKLKRFLIVILAMTMAIMLAFATACKQNDDDNDDGGDGSDTTTTTTVTDYQLIKNGDFEFSTTEKTTYPYSSSINWQRNYDSDSSTAPTSSGTSGIIDTTDEVYKKLSSKNKPLDASGNVINPKTPYHYGLLDGTTYDYEDEDKRVNPQVAGSKVLMINNQHREVAGLGTAQKFKASTTITVAESEYAILSFWVNTVNLKSLSDETPGAYALVTSKLGNETFNNFTLDGIDTKGEWAKFSLYVEGSELGTVSLTITFGLGRGNGTDTNDFVEGFAYFDNVVVEKISKTAYIQNTAPEFACDSIPSTLSAPATYEDNGEAKDYASTNNSYYTETSVKFNYSSIDDGAQAISGAIAYNKTNSAYDKYETDNFVKVGALSTFSQDEIARFGTALDSVATDIGSNPNLIAMSFKNHSSASFTSTSSYTLSPNKYDYFTFFAKVKSDNSKADQLKVELIDEKKTATDKDVSVFSSIATTETIKNGRYGDWVKYKVFVNNPTDKAVTYKIKITYGYDGEWNDVYALQTGYAVVANLSISQDVDEKYYELSSASGTVAKTQLYGVYNSFNEVTDNETGNDLYTLSVDKTQTFTIQNTPATNISGYTFKSKDKDKVEYGLLNSKYVASNDYYGSKPTLTDNVNIPGVGVISGLNEGDNQYAQVMMLYNKEAVDSRFISSVNTVAMNEVMKVSVKVKATGNAVANVYLVSSVVGADNDYEVISFNPSDDINVPMKATVTKDSHTKLGNGDGWTEVVFYIAAGNKDISFRVEIRNGSRENTNGSVGTVYSSGVIYTSMDATKMLSDKISYVRDFNTLYGENDANYTFVSKNYTRLPLVTKSLDEDGNEISETTYFQPTEVYTGNNLIKFVNYTTVDADTEIDNTTATDEETPEETPSTDDTYKVDPSMSLQIVTIIIAVVLILVIIVMVVRSLLKKRERKTKKTQAYYENVSKFDRDARQKSFDKISAKKRKIALAEDDDEEYDYDESQQVDEDDEFELEALAVVEDEEITIDDAAKEVTETEKLEEVTEEVVEETSEENKD